MLSTNRGRCVQCDRWLDLVRLPTAFVHARVIPQLAGGDDRIDAGVLPPGCLLPTRWTGRGWMRQSGTVHGGLEREGGVADPAAAR